MADEHQEHQGVRARAKNGRSRPTGQLQARIRALSASSSARAADLRVQRPECAHALKDGAEVHCTCAGRLAAMGGVSAAFCAGSACGFADLPSPREDVEDGT